MKAATFGEIMLRLSPAGSLRFMQEPGFKAYFGGSEANTAIALAQLGIDTSFITALPENDIASSCVKELSSFGIDCSHIARKGRRMGIYFCENGAGIRPGKVIYDRKNSSFSQSGLNDFDIASILSDASFFHFTGITPALSDGCAALTLAFAKAAHEKGIPVSCDLNYRSTLWSNEKAGAVMRSLMPYVNVLMANDGSCLDVFGIECENNEALASRLTDEFGFDCVALTSRKSFSASVNALSGMLYTEGRAYYSDEITVDIVDRVGGGDAFNAGIIYGLLKGLPPQETVNTANALNAFKHTVEGDYAVFTPEEIKAVASGLLDGRIKR